MQPLAHGNDRGQFRMRMKNHGSSELPKNMGDACSMLEREEYCYGLVSQCVLELPWKLLTEVLTTFNLFDLMRSVAWLQVCDKKPVLEIADLRKAKQENPQP